jgi:hypothetical protein
MVTRRSERPGVPLRRRREVRQLRMRSKIICHYQCLVEAPGIEPCCAVRENPLRNADLAQKDAKRFENLCPARFHLVPSDYAPENIGAAT